MTRKFYITDVFCDDRYSGNQLATVVETDGLDTKEMQQIARAFNFAETTFLTGGDAESGFDVRIFTPAKELPFAGHPTLGTSFVVRDVMGLTDSEQLVLNLGVGPIPVSVEGDLLWMRQNAPVFREAPSAEEVSNLIGIPAEVFDPDFPPLYVSTGIEFLMVPVRSLEALRGLSDVGSDATGVFMFTREGYRDDYDISSRMFARDVGVAEDSATGSANGCLASYILHTNYLEADSIDIKVAQGFEIQRPSSLYLRAKKSGESYEINVGGKVRLVAEGQWVL